MHLETSTKSNIEHLKFISKSKISLDQLPDTQFKEHLIGLANESIQRSK